MGYPAVKKPPIIGLERKLGLFWAHLLLIETEVNPIVIDQNADVRYIHGESWRHYEPQSARALIPCWAWIGSAICQAVHQSSFATLSGPFLDHIWEV